MPATAPAAYRALSTNLFLAKKRQEAVDEGHTADMVLAKALDFRTKSIHELSTLGREDLAKLRRQAHMAASERNWGHDNAEDWQLQDVEDPSPPRRPAPLPPLLPAAGVSVTPVPMSAARGLPPIGLDCTAYEDEGEDDDTVDPEDYDAHSCLPGAPARPVRPPLVVDVGGRPASSGFLQLPAAFEPSIEALTKALSRTDPGGAEEQQQQQQQLATSPSGAAAAAAAAPATSSAAGALGYTSPQARDCTPGSGALPPQAVPVSVIKRADALLGAMRSMGFNSTPLSPVGGGQAVSSPQVMLDAAALTAPLGCSPPIVDAEPSWDGPAGLLGADMEHALADLRGWRDVAPPRRFAAPSHSLSSVGATLNARPSWRRPAKAPSALNISDPPPLARTVTASSSQVPVQARAEARMAGPHTPTQQHSRAASSGPGHAHSSSRLGLITPRSSAVTPLTSPVPPTDVHGEAVGGSVDVASRPNSKEPAPPSSGLVRRMKLTLTSLLK